MVSRRKKSAKQINFEGFPFPILRSSSVFLFRLPEFYDD